MEDKTDRTSESDSPSELSDTEVELIPIIMPGQKSSWEAGNIWQKLYIILRTPFRMLFCISNVTVFFFTYFGFILPVMWARSAWPRLYWFSEGLLYRRLQGFIAYWGYTAGYDVYEYGEDVTQYCERDRVLLMCNHQSTADVPILMAAFQNKGVATRKLVWLMDIMFRWTPFGVIGRCHGDFFIQQGKKTRDTFILKLKDHLRKTFWDRDRRWLVIFVEGGFFYKRIKDSQAYAKKNGFPHTSHVTLPRYGAVKAILEEIGPKCNRDSDNCGNSDNESDLVKKTSHSGFEQFKQKIKDVRDKKSVKEGRPPIEYVIDATIAYPNRIPLSIITLCFGTREKCDIAVHYRVFKASEIPFNDEIALRDWMYKVYQEKDQLLDNYYHTGKFSDNDKKRRVVFEWSNIIYQYTFWIIAFLIQYQAYTWLGSHCLDLLLSPFR